MTEAMWKLWQIPITQNLTIIWKSEDCALGIRTQAQKFVNAYEFTELNCDVVFANKGDATIWTKMVNGPYIGTYRDPHETIWTILFLNRAIKIQFNGSVYGWEPWFSGYGRRLMFWRSWVWIPVPYTGWRFFTIICCKIVLMFHWKRLTINEKRPGMAHLKKTIQFNQGW